jgi:two-component system response regulator NreC
LIVDLMLPALSGLEVIRQVNKRVPRTHIVALSMHANESYVLAALSQYALDAYIQKAKGAPLDSYETLTTRERDVLHLVAQGETTPAIAARLRLSPRTVETHRTNLMRKLGLRSQTDLIRYALQRGLIPLQD